MNFEKENFLRTRFVPLLQKLDAATPARWGKMNLHQMIAHFTEDGFMIANGSIVHDVITPPERLIKFREFLLSDRPFQENTRNPMLPEEPTPPKHKTIQAEIGAMQIELIKFFEVFSSNPHLTTRNPIFGDLNFDENVQLLYKHAAHHLKQFGVII